MIVLLLALAAPAAAEPAPDAAPVPSDSVPAPDPASPAPPPSSGEVIGPPYGSRAGEQREGEVWKPIQPRIGNETQPLPSESAVASQTNPDLADGLSQTRAPADYATPQRFAFEVKMGPYLPDVDRNYGGEGLGPYAQIFGETDERGVATGQPKKGLYGGLAFEWQITRKLAGPIGIGVQWSMFRDRAQALLAEPPDDPEASVRSAADSTRFTVMPIALQAVYRFELLADRVRWAPFVPYVKAGVAYAFWWSKDGNKNIARIRDAEGNTVEKAIGGVWGWQLNLGGMLRLDFLDPGTARRFDRVSGINHTYIFGEWQLTRLANFGRKDSMSVGDSTWMLGLAMEF